MKKLFKKMYFISLICLISMLTLSACSQSKTVTKSDDGAKILNIGVNSETSLLSPLYMDSSNYSTTKMVYENLVNYENGEIKPGLAESWEFANDGKDLIFHIRKGVKLHNEEDFTAEVVKKNLEHKKTNPSFYTLKGVTEIQGMDIVDNYTLTIHYPRRYYAYLSDFCWPDVMPMIAPELLIKGDFQTVKGIIGTGPYKFDKFVSGQYTKFIRNEEYWGEKPYYDEVLVKYIPDSQARLKALKTGEIDLIYGSSLLDYDQYKEACGYTNVNGQISDKDTRARDITLNASSSILKDINVRKAIAYAIDKEKISKGITEGIEEVAELPFTKDSQFFDLKLNEKFVFNKEKANKLLDEAGWKLNGNKKIRKKNGIPLKLKYTTYSSDAINESITTLLKNQLGEVGIDIDVITLEKMEWYQVYMKGDFDITTWLGQYAYANPHCWFNPMDTMTPQTASLSQVEGSEDFFRKIKETQGLDDSAKLKVLFTELINYNLGNVIDIPLTYQKDRIVYNSEKIKGYNFTGVPTFFDIKGLEINK